MLMGALLLFTSKGWSCVGCNTELQQAVKQSIYTNLFGMCAAFIVLALIIAILFYLAVKKYSSNSKPHPAVPLTAAAIVLGIGIGGFADGIVLHQILQWHQMLSAKLPPTTVLEKNVNMFWDGIFHLFTLLSTATGIYLLWNVLRKINVSTSGNLLAGGMLAGWGIFNVIEGVINHHILQLHNVREITSHQEVWNYAFLFFGILLAVSGWLLVRRAKSNLTYLDRREP